MRLRSFPFLIAMLGLAPASALAAPSGADTADQGASGRVQLFNIPAQPLSPALQVYSAVTGNQVLCDSRLAHSRRSSAVVGLFTAGTALRMLLDGTDLTIRYTGPRDITLALADAAVPGDAAAAAGRAGAGEELTLDTLHVDVPIGAEQRPDFSRYGAVVRTAIKRALAKDPATSHRIFDLQIDIWIGPGGTVSRPRLIGSTGIASLDAAIRRVLSNTSVGQDPPSGLPQPVRIAVVSI